jgi:hypothetical protein
VSMQGWFSAAILAAHTPVGSKRGVLKISSECSILYRLLSLMGALLF